MDDSTLLPQEDTGEDAKMRKKVKPVLKHPFEGDGPSGSQREKKELKWDEEVIEEHDQLRGTRQKVCHDKNSGCLCGPLRQFTARCQEKEVTRPLLASEAELQRARLRPERT
jgi:hypothetical protein